MQVGVPVLTACIGLVCRIKPFLLRPTSVASLRPIAAPAPNVRAARATVVLPFGDGAVILTAAGVFHRVVLPVKPVYDIRSVIRRSAIRCIAHARNRLASGGDLRFLHPLDSRPAPVQRLDEFLQRKQQLRRAWVPCSGGHTWSPWT